MTAVQLLAAGGALLTAGLIGLLVWALPWHPDPVDAVGRITNLRAQPAPDALVADSRLGRWAQRRLPPAWTRTPAADLAIVGTSPGRFLGEKVTASLCGLVGMPLAAWALLAWGIGIVPPVAVPVAASLVAAVALWFLPEVNLRRDAARAREAVGRAIGAYLELVAMERQAGSGPRQAMQVAAGIGNSTLFAHLRRELDRSGWNGQPPWDALDAVAAQLGLPVLGDMADTIRLGGEEGAQIAGPLRARATALRAQARTGAQARANATAERLSLPGLVMGLVFTLILVGPSLAALLGP